MADQTGMQKRRPRGANGSAPTLQRGAQGAAVIALQRRLNELGFKAGAADGDFGPGTERAVIAFQRAHGLTADGVVGPRTWTALDVQLTAPVPRNLTAAQLRAIMPELPEARARECIPYLNQAMQQAQIDTRLRRAAFLAQLAVESAELRFFEELGTGEAYEGREDLGNTRPGDGRRYKGRGPIQLTGRVNYRAAGVDLDLDLEDSPELAARIDVGFRVAGWFWTTRGLNALADAGDFREITRRINGGYNGLTTRERYYARAKDVLA
jgi:putative chitinase